ncbi:MAG: C39 family peptidase [Anaerolineales bacterium]
MVADGLPTEHRLTGLDMLWQQYNRCSPTALYMQLSYWDYTGTATEIVRWLNPYNEDKSVRLEELIAFAGTHGFQGIARTGGTRELMQEIVAAGFPILVENAYWHRNDNNDWMSHNRILMGYDSGAFYFYDPLLGPGDDYMGYGIRYDEFDRRWRDFNRNYMIIFPPEDAERLQAILGEHWDPQRNAELTYEQARAESEITPDGFAYYNMGEAQLVLGNYEQAAGYFDQARAVGLPWRFHWYRFGAFEAYVETERYDDVFNLVYEVRANEAEIQEIYYWAGRAAQAQGDLERARANYNAALGRNANYPEAQRALDALNGG